MHSTKVRRCTLSYHSLEYRLLINRILLETNSHGHQKLLANKQSVSTSKRHQHDTNTHTFPRLSERVRVVRSIVCLNLLRCSLGFIALIHGFAAELRPVYYRSICHSLRVSIGFGTCSRLSIVINIDKCVCVLCSLNPSVCVSVVRSFLRPTVHRHRRSLHAFVCYTSFPK